jgi:hypothetical protein
MGVKKKKKKAANGSKIDREKSALARFRQFSPSIFANFD